MHLPITYQININVIFYEKEYCYKPVKFSTCRIRTHVENLIHQVLDNITFPCIFYLKNVSTNGKF